MQEQDDANVRDLLQRAADLPPVERGNYLDEACAGDAALRAELESLLDALDSAAEFLAAPIAASGAEDAISDGTARGPLLAGAPEAVGTAIGPYRLVRKIGEGGMGIVYLAEQDRPVRRSVALKVIKPGMDSAAVINRFEAERQALAMMDHPNIARVLEAGTTAAGRPYFVMDLVEGVPVTLYCDAKRLTPRERLELFIPICQAIQHAHQKGIIHRDVKPTNVLVTIREGKPIPKVIDFGVAKALNQNLTEQTLFTQLGSVVGTLEYMSPEQAETGAGGIDTRSDVYSLGVLLYELLTGTTPLEGKKLREVGYEQMLRAIREEEPPKPSTRLSASGDALAAQSALRHSDPKKLARLLSGDLDWIVMKCLEKDRARRYETANGLARDIDRYLSDEPVEASPPSATYRLRKMARKHETALQVAMAFVLLLIGATVISGWQALRAIRARDAEANMAKVAKRAMNSERQLNLDMQTEAGLTADLLHDPRSAVLWFAKVADESRDDPVRRAANLVRLRTWSRKLPQPLRALPHDTPALLGMTFHPSGRYLMTQSWDDHWFIWDSNSEGKLMDWGNSAMAWSPDGKQLASSSDTDGTDVILRSFPSGQVLKHIEHTGGCRTLAFSADGRLLAMGGATASVWDCKASSFVVKNLPHPGSIWAVVISPAGDRLLTACTDEQVRLYPIPGDPGHTQPLFAVQQRYSPPNSHGLKVPSPAFINGGRQFLTCGGGFVEQHDASTGALTGTANADFIYSLCVAPGGLRFVVGGPRSASLWDATTMTNVFTWANQSNIVVGTCFSLDGRRVATASWDHLVRTFSVDDGREIGLPIRHQTSAHLVAFTPDGLAIATAQEGGLVRLWRPAAGNAGAYDVPLVPEYTKLKLNPDGMHFVPSGTTFGGYQLSTAQVFRTADGSPAGPALALPGGLADAAFSPDGRQLVLLDTSLDVHFVNWSNGEERPVPLGLPSVPRSVAYRPDGLMIAVLCAQGEILLIDPIGGTVLGQLPHLTAPIPNIHVATNGTVLFSADGTSLLSWGDEGPLRVWDVARRGLRYTRTGPLRPGSDSDGGDGCHDVSLSPDGRHMVIAGLDHRASVLEIENGHLAAPPLPHPDEVFRARFSPDGTRVLTACRDGMIRLWDWRAGHQLVPPMAHEDEAFDAAFAQGGRWLVSAGKDKTLRIWEAGSGKRLAPFIALHGAGICLALTPDGRRAIVTGNTNRLECFDLSDLYKPQAFGESLAYTECTSGQEVVGSGVAPLTAEQWLKRWQQVMRPELEATPLSAINSPTTLPSREEAKSHFVQLSRNTGPARAAAIALWRKKITPKIDSISLQVLNNPLDASLLGTRAYLYSRVGRFREAANDFKHQEELNPSDPLIWWHRGPLLAYLEDHEAYRAECQTSLLRFGTAKDFETVDQTTKVALLLPDSGLDVTAALRNYHDIIYSQGLPWDAPGHPYALVKGMSCFRAGEFLDSIEWMTRVTVSNPAIGATADLFRAMAHHRLGHSDDAKEEMEKAVRFVAARLPAAGEDIDQDGIGAENWLICQIALREARKMFDGPAPTSGPTTSPTTAPSKHPATKPATTRANR